MAPRVSLSAFLASAKSALATSTSKKQKLTFVVGNESADLDSLCSALLLAYLRTYTPPHTLHIPLCHLARDDLSLRPEFTEVLRRASASPDDVITLDDLLPSAAAAASSADWLLVDHNSLTGKLEGYADRVIGCIDHHADEGRVPRDASPRVLEQSGSCASLVVDCCREAWDELKSSSRDDAAAASASDDKIDAHLAALALGPIVIDTTNLEAETKTTAYDVEAVRYLEGKLVNATDDGSSSSPPLLDRSDYFAALARLKEDISPLSMRDVLRKDYKEWDERGLKLGTSSIPASFNDLLNKAGGGAQLAKAVEKWGDEKKLDLVAVMTAFKDEAEGGSFSRELMLLARSEKGVEAAERFEREYRQKLDLNAWRGGELDDVNGGAWRKCWTQGKVENSRKQVAPMLRQAMDS
ncbi:Exopolyphosphatase [Neopestalotiopsis sp. 37M]|nr:Exopolyphosphatase [Neopestalotiopsis sp. 37M]